MNLDIEIALIQHDLESIYSCLFFFIFFPQIGEIHTGL